MQFPLLDEGGVIYRDPSVALDEGRLNVGNGALDEGRLNVGNVALDEGRLNVRVDDLPNCEHQLGAEEDVLLGNFNNRTSLKSI